MLYFGDMLSLCESIALDVQTGTVVETHIITEKPDQQLMRLEVTASLGNALEQLQCIDTLTASL